MKSKFYWRINEQIRAEKLRVLDASGKQIDIMPSPEALKKAKEQGLDLIEIAPQAVPPVAKIIELGKFRYQEEKKAREVQKKSKASELKEVRFSPFIGEADFETRLGRVREFLGDGDKVKLAVVFKGRQLGRKQFGYGVIKRIIEGFGQGAVSVDMEPKFLGRNLICVISPKKGINYAKDENKKVGNETV